MAIITNAKNIVNATFMIINPLRENNLTKHIQLFTIRLSYQISDKQLLLWQYKQALRL